MQQFKYMSSFKKICIFNEHFLKKSVVVKECDTVVLLLYYLSLPEEWTILEVICSWDKLVPGLEHCIGVIPYLGRENSRVSLLTLVSYHT